MTESGLLQQLQELRFQIDSVYTSHNSQAYITASTSINNMIDKVIHNKLILDKKPSSTEEG